jgi:hypothetical protein
MNRFADAIQAARVDVVPKIVIGGGQGQNGTSGNGSVLEALLTLMLSEKMGEPVRGEAAPSASPEVTAMKEKIRTQLMGSLKVNGTS